MGLFSWIVLGFLAGLVGGMITGARQARGCLPRIAVGVLGALIGGALARAAGLLGQRHRPVHLVVGPVGAAHHGVGASQ